METQIAMLSQLLLKPELEAQLHLVQHSLETVQPMDTEMMTILLAMALLLKVALLLVVVSLEVVPLQLLHR